MEAKSKLAAQYVRMSTEHQRYSIEHQVAANTLYALEHGYEIVQTFSDAGISGVTLTKRPALQALLADVLGGTARYQTVLVFDVSRWGRFQDPDQAAHYEFVCRQAGVTIQYCAESFSNDTGMSGAIMKSVKRVMAAEFSQELSVKISRAQDRVAAKGYWTNGPPGLGYRRQPMRPDGRTRPILEEGELNGVQDDRVVLVPGPPEEVALVRRIYRECLQGRSAQQIANRLSDEGIPAPRGGRWHHTSIGNILRNEKYTGVLIHGTQRIRFGKPAKSGQEKVRVPGAFRPLISRYVYQQVQVRWRRRPRLHRSDEELISELRALYLKTGRLTHRVLKEAPDMPSFRIYTRRFGSMQAVYALVGYQPTMQQIKAADAIVNRRAGKAKNRYSAEALARAGEQLPLALEPQREGQANHLTGLRAD